MPRTRQEIVKCIGEDFLCSNIENDEWSYNETIKRNPIVRQLVTVDGRTHYQLDRRFVKGNRVSVIVETKQNYDEDLVAAKRQLQCYVKLERILVGHNRIVAILANTNDARIMVWRGDVEEENFMEEETELRTLEEYEGWYWGNTSDKQRVIRSTYQLNKVLHRNNVKENLRSLLVGTCLLALKNGFDYTGCGSTEMIIAGLKANLGKLLEHTIDYTTKAAKINTIEELLFESQAVKELSIEGFYEILGKIKTEILQYINEGEAQGQDILSMFFTTFNKYVYTDKNQVFTPDHIVSFMVKAMGVNRHTKVLDPCCGSGSFLVRSLTEAMKDCRSGEEVESVKRKNIYGIEVDRDVSVLAMTNMLIHSDGNSNLRNDNCFSDTCRYWIGDKNIDVVLMNPPYNARMQNCNPEYAELWKNNTQLGEDPTKGFHFVEYIADLVGHGAKLAVILPVQCALNTSREITAVKKRILVNHHLDAVFTFPPDLFTNAAVQTVCMVFELGIRHDNAERPTFFGYYKDDGLVKKKNFGRVEMESGVWDNKESAWLKAYRERSEIAGFCTNARVTAEDDWVAEAYLKTDYSTLDRETFKNTIRKFIANKIAFTK